MQHGIHNAVQLLEVEHALLEQQLKYHHLLVTEQLRTPRPSIRTRLVERFRSLLAPRPVVSQERAV